MDNINHEMDSHIILDFNDTYLAYNNLDELETNSSFLDCSLAAFQRHDPEYYFSDYFKTYYNSYTFVHGYLSLFVCVFGITTNVLNIIIFTRKNMVSPINAILTGLAVSDMLIMFSYLPFAYNYYMKDINATDKHTYGWTVFTIFYINFIAINYTISAWLTVTVAVWRFIAIRFPFKSSRWCSMRRAKYAITATYITSTIFSLPVYISLTACKAKIVNSKILYRVIFTKISQRYGRMLEKICFWIFGIIAKLIPCVILSVLSIGLIFALYDASKRRRILNNGIEVDKSHRKTTKMLLLVLLTFLLTKIPSGLLLLFSGILGQKFFKNVHLTFAEAADTLSLINSAINFIFYCSMCSKFRDTFLSLFTSKCVNT